MDKIKETFTHINDNWKEENYKTCYFEWSAIEQFISKEKTPYQCDNCNTYWTKLIYLNDHDNICQCIFMLFYLILFYFQSKEILFFFGVGICPTFLLVIPSP